MEGEEKKKKKKKKEEEVKLYPHHKYGFAMCGKQSKKGLSSIFSDPSEQETAISLSYFTRPNTTSDTITQFNSSKARS